MGTLEVSIVTPNGEVYNNKETSLVVLDTHSGQVGIMKNHVPMVATLKIGVLKIVDSNNKNTFFAVSEGFVETHKESLTVIVQTAEEATTIDKTRAEEAKARAEERLANKDNNIDIKRAELALKRALTRLKAIDECKK